MTEQKKPNGELRDIATMTQMIRHKEKEISLLVARRTAAARRHKESGFKYADLAEATGLSEMGVYKMLRHRDGPIKQRKATEKAAAE